MNKLLELKNVCHTYYTKTNEIVAVKDLSFDCKEKEFISIIGPSGCGKTTVLSLIAGLLKPCKGSIELNGKPITSKNNELSYMLQKDHLFEWRTIENNVRLPLEIKKINSAKNQQYVDVLLNKYGLEKFKKSYPTQLSGGMRQRVALIRTLATNPKLLLLDEPFSALDFQTRLNVCEDVLNIILKEQKTSILVTHDISEAIAMSNKIVILTNRPATVKKIYDIPLKERSPIKRRNLPEFSQIFDQIWKELNQ